MSNEIVHSHRDSDTLYALVYSGKTIYVTASGTFAAVGTWDDARAGQCDIPMTAAGDAHFADFPSVPEGIYFVSIRKQAGISPDADDDKPVGQGEMAWNGSSEVSLYTEQTSWFKNG